LSDEAEQPIQLPILYESDHLIAINKPSGLLVHRSALDRHEHSNALRMLRDQTGHYLYPVHRLDKPTSGVLIFALSKAAATALSIQFEEGLVQKKYMAVVRGHCDEGTIDHAVRDRDSKDKKPQDAVTSYTTIATIELPFYVDRYPTTRYSLLQVKPQTGRRHQIRLHMKHISHPIVGDTNYGKTPHNKFFASHYDCHRLMLHAHTISFTEPDCAQPTTITAPVADEQFQRVLDDPRWQWQCGTDANAFLSPRPGP